MTASPFRPVTLINGAEWAAADCRCFMIDNPTFLQCGSVWLLWPLPREALAETSSTHRYSSPHHEKAETITVCVLRFMVINFFLAGIAHFRKTEWRRGWSSYLREACFKCPWTSFIWASPCNNAVHKICRSTHQILKTNNCLNPQTTQIK